MRDYRALAVCFALTSLTLLAPAANAFSYGDFIGTNVDFLNVVDTTTSAGDPDGLFGGSGAPPMVIANQLIFFPTAFAASASGGSSDLTSANLQLTIDARDKAIIDIIDISEFGDADLSGVGTAATNVSVTVSGFVTVLEDFFGTLLGPVVIPFAMTFTPSDTLALPGDSGLTIWEGGVQIDIASIVPNATLAVVQFDNILDANSEVGTTALIQKKVVNGPVISISIVPEPSTALLVSLGLVGLTRRTRRGSSI